MMFFCFVCRLMSGKEMNLLGCLLPCSLKRGWWNFEGTERHGVRTDLLVAAPRTMGASASNTASVSGVTDMPLPQSFQGTPGAVPLSSSQQDGVIVRERKKKVCQR